MSILIRLKNKLQDPCLYETKIREFDECMSYLKNENIELHKRVDQLEALCKTSNRTSQTYVLQEYIRQLEQENGRLITENQYQRKEYQRFLDQLTEMVIRTAVMQENIRKECASIYHVIEQLTPNTIDLNQPIQLIIQTQKKSLSWENLNKKKSSSNDWIFEPQLSILDKPNLQRSETYVISKIPQEDQSSSSLPMIVDDQQRKPTSSTTIRPSRLPARCSISKTQSSNNTSNRSLSTPKPSKLPIRISTSLNRQSNIPIPINRSIPSVKKPIQTQPVIETIKSNNSTSSESSIEEQQQQMNKLLPIPQDEGYSTWSSIDVKDDVIKKNNEYDDRQKNLGFVKTWLDTTNRPVKKVENEPLEQFTQELLDNPSFLCPFVRNRCSNGEPISLTSTTLTSINKDISLDSLDSSQSEEQTITSSSSSSTASSSQTFSRSEIFENIFMTPTLTDSTSSASSTFNMSEYIEDHFIEHDDNDDNNTTEDDDDDDDISTSFEPTIIDKNNSLKPQKRLLFPGILNRLIFFRRIVSESDLQRKKFLNETENPSNVYHSNIINEHSVEVNLINTYGSDTELHVWSHDCAEQRRFLNERQKQQQSSDDIKQNSNQEIALERQILLQQIYEYPWLLQENDLEQTSSDLIVPSHNPDFYQLCTLPNSSSFVISHDPKSRQTTNSSITSTAL